jgi:hypothetical protein
MKHHAHTVVKHHVWCNRMSHDQRPDGTCASCDRLNRAYPPEGHLDVEAMAQYYFPNVIVRKGT